MSSPEMTSDAKRDVEPGDADEISGVDSQTDRPSTDITVTEDEDDADTRASGTNGHKDGGNGAGALHKAAAAAAAEAAAQEHREMAQKLDHAKAGGLGDEEERSPSNVLTRLSSNPRSGIDAAEGPAGTNIAYKLCNCLPIPQWWSNTFILDWAGVVLMAIILLITNGPIDWLKHFPIDMSEVHIQQPLHSDRVSMITVGVLVVVPCVVLAIFFWFKRRDMFEDLHSFALAVLAPVVFAYVVWVIIGNAAGKLRPDFLARCAPTCMENFTWTCAPDPSLYASDSCDLSLQKCCPVQCGRHDPRYPDMLECSYVQNGVFLNSSTLQSVCNKFWDRSVSLEQAECNGYAGEAGYSEFSIREGFRSLPSGHTQVMFNVATTWWLYLAGKLQVYGRGVQQRTFCYGYLMISFMFVLATYVAVTRLNDMKHDMFDIILGAFIGFITSLIAYPLYFQNPTLGGEPLRRPNDFTVKDVLCCRKQEPWPAANTHLAASDYPSSAFAQPQAAIGRQESATLLSTESNGYKNAEMSIV